jgi:hypothetical protein
MKINLRKLMAKAELLEAAVADGETDTHVSVGFVNGIDWQLRAQTNINYALPRTVNEDAFTPGEGDPPETSEQMKARMRPPKPDEIVREAGVVMGHDVGQGTRTELLGKPELAFCIKDAKGRLRLDTVRTNSTEVWATIGHGELTAPEIDKLEDLGIEVVSVYVTEVG